MRCLWDGMILEMIVVDEDIFREPMLSLLHMPTYLPTYLPTLVSGSRGPRFKNLSASIYGGQRLGTWSTRSDQWPGNHHPPRLSQDNSSNASKRGDPQATYKFWLLTSIYDGVAASIYVSIARKSLEGCQWLRWA